MNDVTESSSPEPAARLGYRQLVRQFRTSEVGQLTVPTGHEMSFPVPTARWGRPAVALFAAPADRRPTAPLRLEPPDRWWLLDPRFGSLLAYNLTSIAAFTDEPLTDAIEIPTQERSIAGQAEDQAVLAELMDQAFPVIFSREPLDTELRDDLRNSLYSLVPRQVIAWYSQLAPDFFAALEGGDSSA